MIQAKGPLEVYTEFQLDFSLDMEVFYMLFERKIEGYLSNSICRTGNRKKLSSSQAQLGQATYLPVA